MGVKPQMKEHKEKKGLSTIAEMTSSHTHSEKVEN